MAMTVAFGGSPWPMRSLISQKKKWVLNPLSCSLNPPNSKHHLVLYSKPGCCLCEGLLNKLQIALLLKSPAPTTKFHLEVRDITSNPEWEKPYMYEVPVLTLIHSDGTEEMLPRLSPRMGCSRIEKKINKAVGL